MVLLGVLLFLYMLLTAPQLAQTFWFISGQKPELLRTGQVLFKGIVITVVVTIAAYALALVIGLSFGLMRTSRNPVLFNLASPNPIMSTSHQLMINAPLLLSFFGFVFFFFLLPLFHFCKLLQVK